MFSSDDLLAEFGLTADCETWADGGTIPMWNELPQSSQAKPELQWPQQSQQACMWETQAAAEPVYQPTFNHQAPGPASVPVHQAPGPASVPVVYTSPRNHQFFQNCQRMAMNSSSQFQQIPVNQPITQTSQQFANRGPANYHRAHITLVHNTSGPAKAIIKRKRKRTAFTTDQILALEEVFANKPYVNRDERQVLVEQLQVSDKAVKVWFQNRRIKSKREELEASSSSEFSPIGASDSSDSFGLAYVEAQMSQRTDEFGYVTLDDKAIGELVNVIDGLMGDTVSVVNEEVVESVLKMEYEPVSPAADSGCSDEDAAQWRPPEPEQSLRQLLDIQHFC